MSSSEDERKKRSDSESEEESEEVESEEEETSEEESEEETSEEESTSSDKTSGSASASAKATPRSATTTPRAEAKKEPEIYNPPSPKTKAKEDNGDKKNGKAGKTDKKKKSKKTKKNDEQSVVVIDGRTVLKKTFELAKDKVIEFTVSIENRNYKPEEKVELKFEIKNQTSKTMKSIKCVVESKGATPEGDSKDKKKKKQKKPKKGEAERGVPTGTEDEFFCGARFPLDKYTDFKGTDSYRLPKKIEKSSGTVKHELHLSFPIRSRPINSWKNIDAWLPIEIGN